MREMWASLNQDGKNWRVIFKVRCGSHHVMHALCGASSPLLLARSRA
jgi:hypothetical protein